MKKRGQGLSINTIVVAAIALVVMVLLILIVTHNLRNFGDAVNSCEDTGRVCVESREVCLSDRYRGSPDGTRGCDETYDDKPVCCLPSRTLN